MTWLSTLADSPRPLPEVFIDRLRRLTRPETPDEIDDVLPADAGLSNQLDLPLEDEADAAEGSPDRPSALRADEVAVAYLLGRAFDPYRDLVARLRDCDLIAIIEAPSPELIDPIKRLLQMLVLCGPGPVLDSGNLKLEHAMIASPGTVVLFVAKDEGKVKRPAPANGSFAVAVQRRSAIIGIAVDPERMLPPDLVRLAEHRIVVPPLDGLAIDATIEAVTGQHPGNVSEELARRVKLDTLTVAVRGDLGAQRSLARLARLTDHKAQPSEPAPTLSEMSGLGAARDWGLALIKDLRDYQAGRLPWAAVDRGCLLSGLPGTGKTTFARALAKEAGVHFVATSYAGWQAHREGHLGHVTQAIRNAFAEARQHAPAILFIDEIDTLPTRGSTKRDDDWWTAIINALLEQLDGFERREGVVVIGACNDGSRLDPALVRAGRLDRHIAIPLPDVPALIGILRTHLGEELKDADLRGVALAARGYTGADIERFLREARRKARIEAKPLDLQHVLDAVRGGASEWPEDVRRRIAYHEAGHAVAIKVLGLAEPKSLSIGGSGGASESDSIDHRPLTRTHLEHHIVVLLAGRASEELIFGEGTAGAGGSEGSDLARATELALLIDASCGLGTLGLVCIASEPNAYDLLRFADVRAAVGRTLDQAHGFARDLLANNRGALDALAQALLQAGYLDRAEIAAVLERVPLRKEAPAGMTAPHIANTAAAIPHGDARASRTSGERTSVLDAAADGGPVVAATP